MIIKLSDKVRSIGGVEGEIVAIDRPNRSGTVKVPGEWPGTNLVSIPLNRLTLIEAYSLREGYSQQANRVSIAAPAPYNGLYKSLN